MIHLKTAAAGVISLAAALAGSVSADEVTLGQGSTAVKNADGTFTQTLTLNADPTTTTKVKPTDLMLILDGSGSLLGKNVANGPRVVDTAIKDAKALVASLPEGSQVSIMSYTENNGDSYHTPYYTKLLSKADALKMLDDLIALTPTAKEDFYRVWTPYAEAHKDKFLPVKDMSYEDAYAMQEHKLDNVSVVQFTDGWGYKIYNNDQWLTEDIDHSFADWAKKNAKTFMSVVYPTIEDKEREQKNNFSEPWSIQQMKKAGHPNAYNANGVPDGKREQDIIDAFKHTAIEKAPSTGTISLTPSGSLQIKSVTVTAPDGKVVASNVSDLSKVKTFDQKGAYKVAYTFTGTGSVTGDLTIDGKSDKKTDTLNAVAKLAEPAKRIEKIPYNTKTVDDPTLPLGERKVVQKGVEGEKEITGGTTTSTRKSVDLLAIIDTSNSMVENYGRALESAENLVKSMTDNDTITFAHYQTNGLDSYNTGNGKADGSKANSKPMLLGIMTDPMTKTQAIKYLEDAKTFKVGSNGVNFTLFGPAMEQKGYHFNKEDGKGFQDVYMAHHKADSTISVVQFTDGWMHSESIDTDFANWATKNAKTFMTVSYKNNVGANGGPTEFSINNMKAAGHTNIYDERQTPIDDAKIAKQFEETATEKQVPAKETVIKLPVDEIVHVGTKKEATHPGTVYRANLNETAGTIKVVQEEQAGEQIPGSVNSVNGSDTVKYTPKVDTTTSSKRLPQTVVIFTEKDTVGNQYFTGNDGPDAHQGYYPDVDKFKALYNNMIPGDRLMFVLDENLPETFHGQVFVYEKGKDELVNKQADIWKHRNEKASAATGVDMFKAVGMTDAEVKRADIRFSMDDLTSNDHIIEQNTALKDFITAGKLLTVNIDTSMYPSHSFDARRHTENALKNANIKYSTNNNGVITDADVHVTEEHKHTASVADQTVVVASSDPAVTLKDVTVNGKTFGDGQNVTAKLTNVQPGEVAIQFSYDGKLTKDATITVTANGQTLKTIPVKASTTAGSNKPGQERIIEVGTKPKTDVTKLPFETKYIEDPNLDRGVERIVEVGKEGSSSVTTTYGLSRTRDAYRDSDDYRDPNKVSKGVLKETAEAPKVTPKVDRVIARGTRGITRFVDKATGVELVAREKGNVAKKDIPEYRFVTTETSKEGDVTHYYEQLVTRHVDKATGKEIAPMVKGLTNKQSILGYRFVETKTAANGDRRHVYEQVSTHFVDEFGKEISSTVKGIVAKKDIPNYTYVRQTTADNGDVIHVYHAMMTHFVDELTGDVLAQPETGNQPKKDIAGFTYHTSKIDGEGDMRHFYNGVVTRFVDRIAGAEIAHFEPGRAPKKDIKGYRFFGTTVNDNGHTRHAYEMIVTCFVDKTGKALKKLEKGHAQDAKIDGYRLVSKELKDNGYSTKSEDKDLIYTYEEVSTQFVDESGKALRDMEVGLKDAKAINGYHVVETKVAPNGDRVHVYAKDVVETPKVEQPKVETPKVDTPKVVTSKVDTPKVDTPKVETPKVEQPKVDTPKVERLKVDTPKVDTPNVEQSKVEQPKVDTPKVDTPKVEQSKVDTSKVKQPKVETPKVEQPKVETPKVETPKVKTPKVEAPKVEQPKVEAPKAEQPKAEQLKAETPKVDNGKVIDIKPTTVRVSSDNLIPAKNVVKVDSNDVDVVTVKKDTPNAEQSKVEQPKAEQAKTEQPKAEQPKAEQSKAQTNKELPDAGDNTLMARLSAIPVIGLGFGLLVKRRRKED